MLKIAEIEEALRKNGGFVTRAAKTLGVTYQAIYKRIKTSPKLQAVKAETEETYLDLAEAKLLGLIKEGNLGAICFYLKCKGKKRGYIEAIQVKGDSESKPQPIKIEIIATDGSRTENKD